MPREATRAGRSRRDSGMVAAHPDEVGRAAQRLIDVGYLLPEDLERIREVGLPLDLLYLRRKPLLPNSNASDSLISGGMLLFVPATDAGG